MVTSHTTIASMARHSDRPTSLGALGVGSNGRGHCSILAPSTHGGYGGQGVALMFISARGVTPSPWTPSPPPLDPFPPPRSNSTLLWSLHSYHFFPVLQTPCPASHKYVLRHPVQPCPRAKRNDITNMILYFHFQDRWTGKKRQEAYKCCTESMFHTFLNTPMAALCEFIRQAAIMS